MGGIPPPLRPKNGVFLPIIPLSAAKDSLQPEWFSIHYQSSVENLHRHHWPAIEEEILHSDLVVIMYFVFLSFCLFVFALSLCLYLSECDIPVPGILNFFGGIGTGIGKNLGTGITQIWYRKKVWAIGIRKIWYRKSTGISIKNIWYRKKVSVSVSFNILGTVTL